MMKTVFKTIQFETMPKYTCGLFQMRNTEIKETCHGAEWPDIINIHTSLSMN